MLINVNCTFGLFVVSVTSVTVNLSLCLKELQQDDA